MQRAMARQAEAERERRAKVIAEGEFQASERLKDAAKVLSENPISIQLRYLQTMLEISSERSSTLILPLRSTSSGLCSTSSAATPQLTEIREDPDGRRVVIAPGRGGVQARGSRCRPRLRPRRSIVALRRRPGRPDAAGDVPDRRSLAGSRVPNSTRRSSARRS